MKNKIISFTKKVFQGNAAPTKVMGVMGSVLFGLWALGFFIGILFALLKISSSFIAMLIVIPIMAPFLVLVYTTPFLVLWNIRNAKSKVQIVLLSLCCLFWVFLVGIFTFLIASGITV